MQTLPFALTVAIIVQTITAILWVGAASNRLDQIETQLTGMTALEVRSARLEEQSLFLRDAVQRIETKLDRALTEKSDDR